AVFLQPREAATRLPGDGAEAATDVDTVVLADHYRIGRPVDGADVKVAVHRSIRVEPGQAGRRLADAIDDGAEPAGDEDLAVVLHDRTLDRAAAGPHHRHEFRIGSTLVVQQRHVTAILAADLGEAPVDQDAAVLQPGHALDPLIRTGFEIRPGLLPEGGGYDPQPARHAGHAQRGRPGPPRGSPTTRRPPPAGQARNGPFDEIRHLTPSPWQWCASIRPGPHGV